MDQTNAVEEHEPASYQLVFVPLAGGSPLIFPCDEAGRVDMDHLKSRMKSAYLAARALMGLAYERPMIRRA